MENTYVPLVDSTISGYICASAVSLVFSPLPGVYICKSIVNYLRHGNYICKSDGNYLPQGIV